MLIVVAPFFVADLASYNHNNILFLYIKTNYSALLEYQGSIFTSKMGILIFQGSFWRVGRLF